MGQPAATGCTGDDDATTQADDRKLLTFRPGAILVAEGERSGCRFEVVAGVVEESMGVHLLGRRGAGSVVPEVAGGRATTTCRALTVVRAHPVPLG